MADPLIQDLARKIAHDNAILFIGVEITAVNGRSPLQQIADSLAERITYERPDRSLPAVARDFELLKGRNELIMALREALEKLADEQTDLNQLIADLSLPQTKLVTTRYDHLLEDTLHRFDKKYVLIVRDTDVPSFDESLITLIKLHGDINQPDSLIITEDDLDAFIDRLPTISDVIRAYFATKTLIFIGYKLDGELFKRFFRQVTRNLSAFQRPAYAVVSEPLDEVDERYWQRFNVNVITRDLEPFLESLSQAVKTVNQAPSRERQTLTLPQPTLPERPYKGLDSFSETDAAIFHGRKAESQRLANRILAHRATVLYGVSGSGKTSLLRAGTAPRLARQQALLAVTAPAPDQPLTQLLRDSLIEAGKKAGLTAPESSNLLVTIRNWQTELDGPIVLAIDQFEQFFLAYQEQARAADIIFLQEMLNDRSLNLRLVFIIREDFLGQLQSLEDHLPNLLDIRFRLEPLSREAAAQAIEEPARPFNIVWERSLVQTLLDELTAEDGQGIAPPQLQIICDRLYQEVTAHRAPDSTGPTLISHKLFAALGGTELILGDYLERAVADFVPEQQDKVRLLLGALVTSGGVKQRLPLTELARTAELTLPDALAILERLTQKRLIRRYAHMVEDETEPQLEFELTHDYLAERILLWLGESFWAAQKARELLRQALPEWQSRARLLAPEDLQLVLKQANRLHPTPTEWELIYATAVAYEMEASQATEHLTPQTRQTLVQQLLHHPQSFVRLQATNQLANFTDTAVPQLLAQTAVTDTDTTVRQNAAERLAPLVQETAVDTLLQAAQNPETAGWAAEALITIRDNNPDSQHLLPAEQRGPLRRRVWAQRWQRYQSAIRAQSWRGLKGGFCGLAFGLGLFLGLANALAGGFNLTTLVQRPQTIIQLMSVGLPLAGVVGALVAGSAAFTGSVVHHLQDYKRPWYVWGVTVLTAGVMMAVGMVLLAAIFAGELQAARTALAGLLVGLVLAGAAALPWSGATAVRLGLAIGAGTAVFLAAEAAGLIFTEGPNLWLFISGGMAGAGFYWGLSRI